MTSDSWAPEGAPDAEAIRAAATEILDRPEYSGARGEPLPDFVASLIEALIRFLESFDALYATSPWAYWAIVIGLVAILGLLIAHMVWSITRAMRDRPQPPERPAQPPPRNLVGAARQLAADGHFLEAAHQFLLLCLRGITRRGFIELRPEDTNREVRLRLNESDLPAGLRDELLELVGATELAWFRDRSEDAGLYQRWEAAYARLEREGRSR